ncbi:hypothetical protein D3C73_1612030 [compost metagenome]
MSRAPGTACQAVTSTIAIHARSGLASKLLSNHGIPAAAPAAGKELENRKLKT